MRTLSVAVVGADYPNPDGGNRRTEIAFCDSGERLTLLAEPKNEHDEHAIAVLSPRGFQIGYVASQRAVYLKKLLKDGHALTAIFQDVAPWGAIARVGIDCAPLMPSATERSDDRSEEAADDRFFDFEPDWIPPDD